MPKPHKKTDQKILQPEIFEIKETESRPIIGLPDTDTLKELATLANAIYTPCNWDLLPTNWMYWGCYNYDHYPSPYPENDLGFNGAFMYKWVKGKPVAWAIAIRGTVPSNLDNIRDDILIMLERAPLQIETANRYIEGEISRLKKSVFRDLIKSWDEVPIYLVGHSLGAVIANMAFTNLGASSNGRIQCVGFDNPGSLNIVQRYLKKSGKNEGLTSTLATWVHNIQSDVNIVNTCNEQWGKVYRILRWKFNYGETARALTPINANYIFNYHYLTTYSIIDQHQIANILFSIKNEYPIRLDSSIFGFQEGYKEYIDGEKRKEYWTQYFKYCWDIDADIRDTYKDFNKFADRMFADLKKAYDGLYLERKSDSVLLPKDIARISIESDLIQFSGASRVTPNSPYNWLNQMISSFADYSGILIDHAMDNVVHLITSYAKEIVRDCPSYFPQDNAGRTRYWQNQTLGLMFSNTTNVQSNTMQLSYTPLPTLGR